MPYIDFAGEVPEIDNQFTGYQIYNCLDCSITAQLLTALTFNFNPDTLFTYRRAMRVQQLCLEMSTKGFPIDKLALVELLWVLEKNERRALDILHQCCAAVCYGPLNPGSPLQVADFFYSHLGLPAIYEYDRTTRKHKISTSITALEKLAATYPITVPFVNAIQAARENRKMGSVFRRGLEPVAGALRCSFSPTGTKTGRMSSQQNVYGGGTNAQNLTDRMRQVIAAADGYVIINLDLKTAESLAIGYIAGDRAYIDACEIGDVHTGVAKANWKDLPWTGDLSQDKVIAETPYYRHFSYRDMAKRGGHGTNYFGTARTMAMTLKLPVKVLDEFQSQYFFAFPGIKQYHLRIIAQIQQTGIITSPMRREHRFWGRPNDAATWREAIAFGPQSLVAEVINDGLIACQEWILSTRQPVSLLAQVHDAGVFLCPASLVHQVVPKLLSLTKIPIDFPGVGVMVIGADVTVGRLWSKDYDIPCGQRKYSPATDYTK